MDDQGTLVLVSGPTQWQGVLISGAQVLGRKADAELHLPLGVVARQQMRLTCEEDVCWVENLGTVNPTYLNGRPLLGRTRLQDGDLLGIGLLRLCYHAAAKAILNALVRGALDIVQAGRANRTVMLRGDALDVGRDPTCDVVLDYPAVSRRHLRLQWQPGMGYRVFPLHSREALAAQINGRRLAEPVLLLPGHWIWLGDALGNGITLVFRPQAGDSEEETPA